MDEHSQRRSQQGDRGGGGRGGLGGRAGRHARGCLHAHVSMPHARPTPGMRCKASRLTARQEWGNATAGHTGRTSAASPAARSYSCKQERAMLRRRYSCARKHKNKKTAGSPTTRACTPAPAGLGPCSGQSGTHCNATRCVPPCFGRAAPPHLVAAAVQVYRDVQASQCLVKLLLAQVLLGFPSQLLPLGAEQVQGVGCFTTVGGCMCPCGRPHR